jgi:hypothetical protein
MEGDWEQMANILIRVWKEYFICDLKLQWDCNKIRYQDTASEDWEALCVCNDEVWSV